MGGMGGMPGMGMNGAGAEPKKDKPVEHDLNVSLEDLYTGKTKKMKIHRKVPSDVIPRCMLCVRCRPDARGPP
jgi:DnaJ-class molecular chaperone